MVLHTQRDKSEGIPSDAIVLTRQQAVKLQNNIIHSWKPASDVFALKYGFAVLGSASALTAIYIHAYYRKKLKLLHHGRMISYLPSVIIPSTINMAIHHEKIRTPILIQEVQCPTCVEVRASFLQGLLSVVYPTILAPLTCFLSASLFFTYDVPSMSKQPRAVYNLWKRLTKPKANVLLWMFFAQCMLATTVVYYEYKAVHTVQEVILQREKDSFDEQ